MIKQTFWVFALLLPVLSGCFVTERPYTESRTYDVAFSGETGKHAVTLKRIRNLSGADRRFLVKKGASEVSADEYSRWQLVPEQLLERAFLEYFPSGTSGVTASVVLTRFECDADKKEARLAWQVQLSGNGRSQDLRGDYTAAYTGAADGAAQAMNKCIAEALAQLDARIGSFLEGEK